MKSVIIPIWCHHLFPVFSTVTQSESDSAARRSIHACCDTDTRVAAQLSRISPIRGVKQYGQLPLSKAQAAVPQAAAQILLHAFPFQFPDLSYRCSVVSRHPSSGLASCSYLCQEQFSYESLTKIIGFPRLLCLHPYC